MKITSRVVGWSDAKFKGFIVSALRGAFRRYPPKQQAIEAAYVCTKINEDSGRMAKHYECAKCHGIFPRKKVDADHTKPIVGKEGFVDWNTWIDRGFIAVKGFKCLCKECHKIKTGEERTARAKRKK